MTEYKKKVKTKLIERDMSITDLAKVLGCSARAIHYELKGKELCPGVRQKINEYLGIRSRK